MVRTKVFVGNLAFTTKEPELAAAFQAAGKVIGANIITRGPRSLGYGFVEMDSEEDAEKAVELLNKKELNGRQINVEVARPREELKEKAETEADSHPPRRRRRPQRRSTGGREKKDSTNTPPNEENQTGDSENPEKRRRRRFPRRKVSETPREESTTTLFVANLPFALDDEAFEKTVAELGVKPKAAHVVKKRNGRSKGYGFVEFDSEADQKKALDGLNKKTVDGRELSVKIALTELPKDEIQAAQPAEKKVAPAQSTEKKVVQPAEKKVATPAQPAEKKVTQPAEKKATTPAQPAEKKAAAPAQPAEKKATQPAEKKVAQPAEKKSAPVAEKKTEAPATKSSEKK